MESHLSHYWLLKIHRILCTILNILKSLNINFDFMLYQYYDDVNVINGIKSGVQALIK